MKKSIHIFVTAGLLGSIISSISGQAFAFSDVDSSQSAILSLEQAGIINGIDQEHFAPKEVMNYAQALQLLVNAFDLNLDNLQFFKEPLASDNYPAAKDHVSYSNALIITFYHNLQVDRSINPAASISREVFGDLLVRALEQQESNLQQNPEVAIVDKQEVKDDFQGTIQRLVDYGLAKLDQESRFHPAADLTREEAAVWVYRAIELLHSQKG